MWTVYANRFKIADPDKYDLFLIFPTMLHCVNILKKI